MRPRDEHGKFVSTACPDPTRQPSSCNRANARYRNKERI